MEKLRLRNPHESLALIPHLIGFRPMNAIMLWALTSGPDHSSGPIIRIEVEDDLPHDLIDVVINFVDTFDVEDLVIAWYGSDLEAMINNHTAVEILDTAGVAAQHFIDKTLPPPDDGYVTVSLTDYTHWAGCLSLRDVPYAGFDELVAEGVVQSFDELNESPALTELVFHGSAPFDSEPKSEQSREPWSVRSGAVIAARAERLRTSQRRKCGNAWHRALEDIRAGLAPEEAAPTDEIIGLLNAGLDSILLRDRVILAAVNSNITEILKVKKHEIARLLGEATTTTSEHLTAIIELVEYIAAFSDDDDPAAFAVAAYLRWWAGDLETACNNAVAASASNPHYSLAKLVLHALFVDLPAPISDM